MKIWDFIQSELLGMAYLNRMIGSLLEKIGIATSGKWGGSLQFFLYDTIKITILLCVLIYIISYIQSFFPPERSRTILGRYRGISAHILGALLGTLTPFCSCSSIPLFIGFTRAGLPLGVTFSFLISSPMVDLASLVLLSSIFGAKVAVAYVVAGLVIAIAGGLLMEKLHLEKYIVEEPKKPCCCCCRKKASTSSPAPEIASRWLLAYREMVSTFKKVFPYILLGVGIGALIHNWIPEEWVVKILGNKNPISVILAVLAGVPMYADIFGSIPVAEALLGKGAQLGTVLSFMMAVTTLSLPSLILLRKVIQMPLLIIFTSICIFGIILVGYLFNLFTIFLL